jgi:serine/threonine protein kinase
MSSDQSESVDFILGKQLGQGGYGLVYRGTFRGRDAIKRILIGRQTPERSSREYEVMRILDHPNVMKLLHMKEEKEFRLTRS